MVDGYQTVLGQGMRVTEHLVFAHESDRRAVTIVMFQRKLGDAQMDGDIREVMASVRVLDG